ncbi:hypothetical protein [Streptomyces sp. NPDC059008]|uniref:hypothetical protein n=1 Tax=Streptomyces sp. NPDC059008 TaxID=3346693 RepID=UPI00367904B1
MSGKKERALDLYLLLAAVTGGTDHSATDWSTTWARCVDLHDEKTGGSAVSRAWKTLRDLRLIATERGAERKTKVTKLLEDGTGSPYIPPGSGDRYFQLPFEYWENELHNRLTLPGKAMLLISLSLRKEEFALVQKKIHDWYGLSTQTIGNGVQELRDHDVLEHVGEEWYDTLHTKSGRGVRPLYSLIQPYHHRGLTPADKTPAAQ